MDWVSEVGARLHSAHTENVFLSVCWEKLGKQYLKVISLRNWKKNDLPWEMPVVLQLIHLMFVKAKLENVSVSVNWTDLNADLGKKYKRFIYKTSRGYTQNVREGQGFQGSTGSGEGKSTHAPTLLSATPHTILSHNTLLFTPPHFWDSHSCSGSPRTGIKDRTRESIYQERWEIRTWNITRKTWEKVLEPGNTNESSLTVQQLEALNHCLKWWMGVAG